MHRVLAFVQKPVGKSPGQRFRLEQWAPYLRSRHGIELDFCEEIVERLSGGKLKHHRNDDQIDEPQTDLFGWPSAAD